MIVVTEEQFRRVLRARLGGEWGRALTAFRRYGLAVSYDVTHILLQAVDRKKTAEVLDILEEHCHDVVQFEYPDVRRIAKLLGLQRTTQVFQRCMDAIETPVRRM
jgi:hypothetical protein